MPSRRNPSASSRLGFTLFELMIAVAIIGAILAVALPSFRHSRLAVNEGSAVATLRTVVAVNEQYRVRFGSYAGALADLAAEGYLDRSVADLEKAGYTFAYSGASYDFTFRGAPTDPGASGNRYFHVDSSGIIRFSTAGAAASTDSAISQ